MIKVDHKDKAKKLLEPFIEGSKTFEDAKHHTALMINLVIGASREDWIIKRWYKILEELNKIEQS